MKDPLGLYSSFQEKRKKKGIRPERRLPPTEEEQRRLAREALPGDLTPPETTRDKPRIDPGVVDSLRTVKTPLPDPSDIQPTPALPDPVSRIAPESEWAVRETPPPHVDPRSLMREFKPPETPAPETPDIEPPTHEPPRHAVVSPGVVEPAEEPMGDIAYMAGRVASGLEQLMLGAAGFLPTVAHDAIGRLSHLLSPHRWGDEDYVAYEPEQRILRGAQNLLEKSIQALHPTEGDPYAIMGIEGTLTRPMRAEQARRSQEMHELGLGWGITYDAMEQVVDVCILIAQLKYLGMVTPALAGKPTGTAALMQGQLLARGQHINHVPKLFSRGAFGAIRTHGQLDERIEAGMTLAAYNATPHIANMTGQVGFTTQVIDVGLNSFIGIPEYIKMAQRATREDGSFDTEAFMAEAIPFFAMDVVMAYGTRGLPENQRIDTYRKLYADMYGRKVSREEAREMVRIHDTAGKEMEKASIEDRKQILMGRGYSERDAEYEARASLEREREMFERMFEESVELHKFAEKPEIAAARAAKRLDEFVRDIQRPRYERGLIPPEVPIGKRVEELRVTVDDVATELAQRAERMGLTPPRVTPREEPARTPDPERPLAVGDKVIYEKDGKEYTIKNVTEKGNITLEEKKGTFQPHRLQRVDLTETPIDDTITERGIKDDGARERFQGTLRGIFREGDTTPDERARVLEEGSRGDYSRLQLEIERRTTESTPARVQHPVHEVADPILFKGTLELARTDNPRRLFVDAKDLKDYEEARTFMLPEGKGGAAVTKDGDIVSVFKNIHNTGDKERVLPDLIFHALERGGNRLDCFGKTKDGFDLSALYARFGFEPVAKLPWNDAFAPEGWDYERFGRPDIVFMRHTGESVETVKQKYNTYPHPGEAIARMEYIDDWDKGVEAQLAPRETPREGLRADRLADWKRVKGEIDKDAPDPKVVDPMIDWVEKRIADAGMKIERVRDKDTFRLTRTDKDGKKKIMTLDGKAEFDSILGLARGYVDHKIKSLSRKEAKHERREPHPVKKAPEKRVEPPREEEIRPDLPKGISRTDRETLRETLRDTGRELGKTVKGDILEKPPPDAGRVQQDLFHNLGLRAFFYWSDSDFGEMGTSKGTRIFIRDDTKGVSKPWIGGHEAGHAMSRMPGPKKEYQDIEKAVGEISKEQVDQYADTLVGPDAWKQKMRNSPAKIKQEMINDEIANIFNHRFGDGTQYESHLTPKQREAVWDNFEKLIVAAQKANDRYNKSVVKTASEREDIDYASRTLDIKEKKDRKVALLESISGTGRGVRYEIEYKPRSKESLLSLKHSPEAAKEILDRINSVPLKDRKKAIKLETYMDPEKKDSKLYGQPLITLSRGCSRIQCLLQAVEAGIIPREALDRLSSCHLGCYKNFDDQAKRTASPFGEVIGLARQLVEGRGPQTEEALRNRREAKEIAVELGKRIAGIEMTDEDIKPKRKADGKFGGDRPTFKKIKEVWGRLPVEKRGEIYKWLHDKGWTRPFIPYEGRQSIAVATPEQARDFVWKINEKDWRAITETRNPLIRGNQDGDWAAEVLTGTWKAYADAFFARMERDNQRRLAEGKTPLPEKKLVGITSGWYVDIPDKQLREIAEKYGDKLVLHITGPLDFPYEVDLRNNAFLKFQNAGLRPIMRLISDEFNQGGKALNDRDSIERMVDFLIDNKIDPFRILETPLHLDDPRLKYITKATPANVQKIADVMKETQQLTDAEAERLAHNIIYRNRIYGREEPGATVKDVGKGEVGLTYERLREIGIPEGKLSTLRGMKYIDPGKRAGKKVDYVFPMRCCTTGKCGSCTHTCMTNVEEIARRSYNAGNTDGVPPDGIKEEVRKRTPIDAAGIARVADTEFMARKLEVRKTAEEAQRTKEIQSDLKKLVPKLKGEYRDEARKILEGVDWRVQYRTEKKLAPLREIREYLEKHPNAVISDYMSHQLKLLDKTSIQRVDMETLETALRAVKQVARINEMAEKGRVMGELQEIDNLAHRASSDVKRKHIALAVRPTKRTKDQFRDQTIGVPQRIHNLHLTTEVMTRQIEGKDGGVLQRVFHDNMARGHRIETDHYLKGEDFLKGAIGKSNPDNWSTHIGPKAKKIQWVDCGVMETDHGKMGIKLSPAEVMSLYLHGKNEQNRASLLEGGFKINRVSKYGIIKLTEEKLDEIIGKLTPEQTKVADAMSRFLNETQKEEMNRASRDLIGDDVARVFDYWPKRHPKEVIADEYKHLKRRYGSHRILEEMGFLQPRTGAKDAILLDDAFRQYVASVKDGAQYIGLAQPIRTARMLLQQTDRDKDGKYLGSFRATMEQHGLKEEYKHLQKAVDYMEGKYYDPGWFEQVAHGAVRNIYASILGLNLDIAMKQPISFAIAGTELNKKHWLKGMTSRPGEKTWEKIRKYSSIGKQRERGMIHPEQGDIMKIAETSRFVTGRQPIQQKMTGLIRGMDKVAVGRIWKAVEAEMREKHPDLKGDEFYNKVARRWEQVLDRTQVGGPNYTQSALRKEHEGLAWKVSTMFTSQRNKNYNTLVRSWLKYQESNKTWEDKSELMSDLFIVGLAQSFLVVSATALGRRLRKTKNQDDLRCPWTWAGNIIEAALSNVYFAGQAAGVVRSYSEHGWNLAFSFSDPLTDTITDGLYGMGDVMNVIREYHHKDRYASGTKEGELKWETTIKRAIRDVGSFGATMAKGLPVNNAVRYAEALVKHVYPEAEHDIDSIFRNPQSQEYYQKLWENIKRGNEDAAELYMEFLYRHHGLTLQRLGQSGSTESYELDKEHVDKAKEILKRIHRQKPRDKSDLPGYDPEGQEIEW